MLYLMAKQNPDQGFWKAAGAGHILIPSTEVAGEGATGWPGKESRNAPVVMNARLTAKHQDTKK
jgi:hypothetical protein